MNVSVIIDVFFLCFLITVTRYVAAQFNKLAWISALQLFEYAEVTFFQKA